MASEKVVQWLLEEDQPAIRYLTLTRLLGRPAPDKAVKDAQRDMVKRGWAAEILAQQNAAGWWVHEKNLYQPKYLSTNWMLLVLADLGLTRAQPPIARACELWLDRFARSDGGFGADGMKSSHLCVVGNTARALVQFGYADEPRVRSAFEWLARNAAKLGGWSCFGSGRNLDSWEPLSAFAVYPRALWSAQMKEVVARAAEFYLQRELHIQGDAYAPWERFHYPAHYYFDLLVGLDFMTALGYGDDPRLGYARALLKKKRRRDGRWNLDAVHPDVEGGMADWYRKNPKKAPAPLVLEKVGAPSKLITLTALRVLQRLGE